jgi:hypothetical protein
LHKLKESIKVCFFQAVQTPSCPPRWFRLVKTPKLPVMMGYIGSELKNSCLQWPRLLGGLRQKLQGKKEEKGST